MKTHYFLFHLFLFPYLYGCGVIPQKESEPSGDDFKKVEWVDQYEISTASVTQLGAIPTTEINFGAIDSEKNVLLLGNQNKTYKWKMSSKDGPTTLNAPTYSSGLTLTNGIEFLNVDQIMRLGSFAQDGNIAYTLNFDVMEHAVDRKEAMAIDFVKVLHFMNRQVLIEIEKKIYLIDFDMTTASVQKFPIPDVVQSKISAAKVLGGGLMKSGTYPQVMWLQTDHELFFAMTRNQFEFSWRGPYKIKKDGQPISGRLILGQNFRDDLAAILSEGYVITDSQVLKIDSASPAPHKPEL